jgi:hypothetical protein
MYRILRDSNFRSFVFRVLIMAFVGLSMALFSWGVRSTQVPGKPPCGDVLYFRDKPTASCTIDDTSSLVHFQIPLQIYDFCPRLAFITPHSLDESVVPAGALDPFSEAAFTGWRLELTAHATETFEAGFSMR